MRSDSRSDEVFDGFFCRELRRIVEEQYGFARIFLPECVQLLRLTVPTRVAWPRLVPQRPGPEPLPIGQSQSRGRTPRQSVGSTMPIAGPSRWL